MTRPALARYALAFSAVAPPDPLVLAPGAAFLREPFSVDELARKVREVLDAT